MIFQNARRVIAALGMVTAATAQSFTPIAGYNPRTNVTDKLEKDLIEKQLQELMIDEECNSIALAESYYRNGAGTYLQSIPTYGNGPGETIAEEYEEYRKYYNDDFFHLEWVDKAFDRGITNFPNFNANFSFFPNDSFAAGECVGQEESVKKATGYVFTLIESIQLMQKAIDLVASGCIAQYDNTCEDAMNAWDAAAATYVGSIEGEKGKAVKSGYYNGERAYGNFLFALADKRCRNYKNCGPNRDEGSSKFATSPVNAQILSLFSAGSHASYSGDSQRMSRYKRLISNKIAIPFIQGLFRYAWRLSNRTGASSPQVDIDYSVLDKEVAEAATFAFGVLPKIYACSKKGAGKVADELQIGGGVAGNGPVDFENIRLGVECNYECLGVTCNEVGSLYDGEQLPRFGQCLDSANGSSRCGKPRKSRKQLCKMFTGKPGIKGRNKNLLNPDFIF